MPRDHPYALVDPGGDVVRRAALQESDAVVAAGRQDTVARRLHFRRIRLGRNRVVAERKTEITGADLGKSQTWHREDRFAIGDAFGAFQLYPEQQLTFWIERP